MAPCPCSVQANNINHLYTRIAVLETELAAAKKEKEATENSSFHIVRLAFKRAALIEGGQSTNTVPGDLSTTSSHILDGDDGELLELEKAFPATLPTAAPVSNGTSNKYQDSHDPPDLDLKFRGLKTTHDEVVETKNVLKEPAPRQPPESEDSGAAFEWHSSNYPGRPDFFRYGIRYEPPSTQPNTFHQVVITNLPPGVPVSQVMEQIRGGTVVSCHLLNTETIMGGTWTALVRFREEKSALTFDDHVAANPLLVEGQQADVSLVATPSYPLPLGLDTAIRRDGHTRCLLIKNFPSHLKLSALRFDLRTWTCSSVTAIEHMELQPNGDVEIRFTSILHAGKAYGILTHFRAYRQLKISFMDDPCAQPFEQPPTNPEYPKLTSTVFEANNLASSMWAK